VRSITVIKSLNFLENIICLHANFLEIILSQQVKDINYCKKAIYGMISLINKTPAFFMGKAFRYVCATLTFQHLPTRSLMYSIIMSGPEGLHLTMEWSCEDGI
jgi:hypothetical protein